MERSNNPSSKKLKKQIKSLKKGLAREKKITEKVRAAERKHAHELALLKKEIAALKKKKKTTALSAYNKFMRAQIRKGKTFKQAAALWRRQKRLEEKKARKAKRSAYNIFVSAQLKRGKTMKEAIKLWNELKKPKSKNIAKVKIKPSVKIRVVRPKPKIVHIPKTKIIEKVLIPEEKLNEILLKLESSVKENIEPLSKEEAALRIVDLYFKEVARLGYKATLDLDQVINAYFYALCRLNRSNIEIKEIFETIKKNRLVKEKEV